jgi:uncharacterized membrane protein
VREGYNNIRGRSADPHEFCATRCNRPSLWHVLRRAELIRRAISRMPFVQQESRARSAAKALTWRLLGSADTLALSYVLTGSASVAGSIAGAETLTKSILYYLHERAWGLSGKKRRAATSRLPDARLPRSALRRQNDRPDTVVRSPPTAHCTALELRPCEVPAALPDRSRPRDQLVRWRASIAAIRSRRGALLWSAAAGSSGALLTYICLALTATVVERATEPTLRRPISADSAKATTYGGDPAQLPAPPSWSKADDPLSATARALTLQAALLREAGEDVGPSGRKEAPDGTEPEPVKPTAAVSVLAREDNRKLPVLDQAEGIQQRLMQLGYLSISFPGPWGQRSREALRAFKAAHQLEPDDSWDERAQQLLFGPGATPADGFIGTWLASPNACRNRPDDNTALRTYIDNSGARAGDTSCSFSNKHPSGDAWVFTAKCRNPREHWTARVRLQTTGNKLSWSSQRGTQVYSRCQDRMLTAEATL